VAGALGLGVAVALAVLAGTAGPALAGQLQIEVEGDDSGGISLSPVQLVVEVEPTPPAPPSSVAGESCQLPRKARAGASAKARRRAPRCDSCSSQVGFDPWPWEALFDPVCAIDETLLAEPGSGMADSVANLALGGLATLLPSVGLRFGSAPNITRLQLSWPWSLPLGPAMSTSSKAGPCRDRTFELKPIRLLLEPGLAFTSPTTLFARPGLRFVLHPPGWKTGFGGGVGSTIEFAGTSGLRGSVSPELLLHWGKCCEPGFATFTLRFDRYFAGEDVNAVSAGAGFSFY
jgi:hypothetical protein